MSGLAWIAVFTGAGLGAWLRWWLGGWLNPLWPVFPLGTLAANLGGGLLVGVAAAFFADHATAPEWRLFVITGFMGGLTTFSTFSVEVVTLIGRQEYAIAALAAAAHLVGSLLLTGIGIAIAHALFARA